MTSNKVTTRTLFLARSDSDRGLCPTRSWRPLRMLAAAALLWGAGHVSTSAAGPETQGYWTVEAPELVDFEVVSIFGVQVRNSPQTHIRDICFIAPRLPAVVATCSTALGPTDDGSIDHDVLRLRWAVGPASLLFTGTKDGAGRFVGTFTARSPGLTVAGDIPARLSPLRLPDARADRPPSVDLMQQVLKDLSQGHFERDLYEPNGLKHVKSALAWGDAKAATRRLAYLGQVHIRWRKQKPDVIDDVYEVRSDAHRSICRIAFSPRGRVTDFACRQIE